MNYFSHYYYAHHPSDVYFNVGLILPDFSRSALGARRLKLSEPRAQLHFESLRMGCLEHYRADEVFHASTFFNEMEREINQDLKQMNSNGQRRWFMAHILVEMLLDRVLMEKDPGALDRFYSDLELVDWNEVGRFLLDSGKTDIEAFVKHQEGFRKYRFIYQYQEAWGMVEALGRVVLRTGQPALGDEFRAQLENQIPNWLERTHKTEKPRSF